MTESRRCGRIILHSLMLLLPISFVRRDFAQGARSVRVGLQYRAFGVDESHVLREGLSLSRVRLGRTMGTTNPVERKAHRYFNALNESVAIRVPAELAHVTAGPATSRQA